MLVLVFGVHWRSTACPCVDKCQRTVHATYTHVCASRRLGADGVPSCNSVRPLWFSFGRVSVGNSTRVPVCVRSRAGVVQGLRAEGSRVAWRGDTLLRSGLGVRESHRSLGRVLRGVSRVGLAPWPHRTPGARTLSQFGFHPPLCPLAAPFLQFCFQAAMPKTSMSHHLPQPRGVGSQFLSLWWFRLCSLLCPGPLQLAVLRCTSSARMRLFPGPSPCTLRCQCSDRRWLAAPVTGGFSVVGSGA